MRRHSQKDQGRAWPIWTQQQGNNGGKAVEGSLRLVRCKDAERKGDKEWHWGSRHGREPGTNCHGVQRNLADSHGR